MMSAFTSRARTICSRALRRAPGAVGALLMSRWIFVGKDTLRFQIEKLLITIIAQKQRLLAVADEYPSIVGNYELAHDGLRSRQC